MTRPATDLVVNCYERTYQRVLAPGFFGTLAQQSRFPFAGRVALVNNVEDRRDAARRAERLVESGELTGFHFVEDELRGALLTAGVSLGALGPIPQYSDYLFVGVALKGSPWLVYWDADVTLREPVDWITPAIALMEADRRVLVANPDDWHHPAGGGEVVARHAGFSLGRGFSDQLFLARRADMARPIYGERCVATTRDPLAHLGYTFEMRVDAHMRHNGMLRAGHLGSHYVHPPETAGASYPSLTPGQRLRRLRNMAVVAYLRGAPRALVPECSRDLAGLLIRDRLGTGSGA